MEVGTRQGVCNNSPAEWIGPENGWRSSVSLIPDLWGKCDAPKSRRAWRSRSSLRVRTRAKRPLVQILVVVASIQMRTLKTEVEKGSV